MAKSKFTITYAGELDTGDLPPEALAEYLMEADAGPSDYNLWEVMGNSMDLKSVEVVE